MLNRAQLIGHVGKDPEIRTTTNGTKVAQFSLATSESWTDKTTGEKKDKTEWHRVVIWGNELISKLVEPYVTKGSKLYIEGAIRTREYDDANQVKRWTTEIVVQGIGGTIQLLDRKEGGGSRPPAPDQEPETRYVPRSDTVSDRYHAPSLTPPSTLGSPPAVNGGAGKHLHDLNDEIPF